MRETHDAAPGRGALRPVASHAVAAVAADLLHLAAAPTFAAMALLTSLAGGGSPEALCSSASPLNGMVPMYLLMSAFHLAPWLKLISRRRNGGRPHTGQRRVRHGPI